MLLLGLVGNSTFRHALVEGEAILHPGVISLPRDGSPLPSGSLPRVGVLEAVVLGSVNPARLEEVVSGLSAAGAPVLVAGRDLPVPISNRYRDPSQAGVDRLLNALGAARTWPGRGVVVLDFGTALSVSVVSPTGEFLGGPIAGGLSALGTGLRRSTAQLPEVGPVREAPRLLATSTADALRAGVYWQVAGAARSILEGLRGELPFPFQSVVTGGDARLFAPAVPGIDRVDPELGFRGLLHAYLERV